MEKSARSGLPARGSSFWLFLDNNAVVQLVDGSKSKVGGEYGVFATDSTFQIVKKHAATMLSLSSASVNRKLLGGGEAEAAGERWEFEDEDEARARALEAELAQAPAVVAVARGGGSYSVGSPRGDPGPGLPFVAAV